MDVRRRHERSPGRNYDHRNPQELPMFKSNYRPSSGRNRRWWLLVVIIAMVLLIRRRVPLLPQQYPLPLVCSHQILNPPSTTNNLVPLDGSLDAMTSLWQSGVHCFDVDVITLQDGTLLTSHPRRLAAAIQTVQKDERQTEHMEDFTLQSLSDFLGLKKTSSSHGVDTSSPFPIFDTEVLPHFAQLSKSIPGAFAHSPSPTPWALKGPLLNIDLKQGPHLTREKVLELANQIHALDLEEYVAICVTSDKSQPNLLKILHEYNLAARHKIPLTLVLRDLVPEDVDVDRIRRLVQDLYPESIRALVPSFKFPRSWYEGIRQPRDRLWRLPMTVWTIDSRTDYEFVTSIVAPTTIDENGNDWKGLSMASAVVANRPMELLS